MAAWIAAAADGDGESGETAHRRLDLVIANAAISGGTGGDGLRPESGEQTRRIFAANLDGVLNTVLPAIAVMRNQPPLPGSRGIRGQIAIVSSLAGFRGFPGAPAYSASKAAVKAWGEGLRPALARDGIAVSVVCPGFVRTPMTAGNPFPMPFLMEPKRAAAIIRRGLAGNRARIAFPWPLAVVAWLTAALSPAWLDPLLARLPEKPARSGS